MKLNPQNHVKPLPLAMAIALLFVGGSSLSLLGHANAAQFTQAFVRLDRLSATTATGGRVCVKPSAGATVENTIEVKFPTTAATDYVVNATAANWTTNVTALDTGQTALPITGNVASSVSGKTVIFTVTSDLVAGTLYCFNFSGTSTLTTSSASAAETTQGTVTTKNGASVVDTTTYSESIITNDQVVINAVVPPSFSFVLNGNTDSFASNLSTTAIVSTNGGRTVTINTNAATGWIVWVKDLNTKAGSGALNSVTAGNYKIGGVVAPGAAARVIDVTTNHLEDYGLATSLGLDASGGGTVSLDAAYFDNVGTKVGTLDPTQFRPIASSNGTANGDVINLIERATVTGATPAANDYTDTMTVVGAGSF